MPPSVNEKSLYFNPKNKKYIFVSYSHLDKDKVYADLERLSKLNCNFWYDAEFTRAKSNSNWTNLAAEHMLNDNCVGVLFYISKNSFVSNAVYSELQICMKKINKSNFTYKIILIDGNNLYEIQQNATINPSNFSSERIIDIYKMFGVEKLYTIYDKNGSHIEDIVKWFLNNGCVNDVDYDNFSKAIVRKNYIIIDDKLISYFGKTKDLEIYEEDKKILKTICANSISSPYLKNIDIPEGITTIEDFAIIACTSLVSLKIPKTVVKMGYYGISNFNFSHIIIDENNPNYCINHDGFVYEQHNHKKTALFASPCNNKIDKLIIEEGTVLINDFAISNCLCLKHIYFPKSIKRIGYWSLRGCSNLKDIFIYPNIEYISPHSFDDTNIKVIYFIGNKEALKIFRNIVGQRIDIFNTAKILCIEESDANNFLK